MKISKYLMLSMITSLSMHTMQEELGIKQTNQPLAVPGPSKTITVTIHAKEFKKLQTRFKTAIQNKINSLQQQIVQEQNLKQGLSKIYGYENGKPVQFAINTPLEKQVKIEYYQGLISTLQSVIDIPVLYGTIFIGTDAEEEEPFNTIKTFSIPSKGTKETVTIAAAYQRPIPLAEKEIATPIRHTTNLAPITLRMQTTATDKISISLSPLPSEYNQTFGLEINTTYPYESLKDNEKINIAL